jgi:hypothetical protein
MNNIIAKTISNPKYSWAYVNAPKDIEKFLLEFGEDINSQDLFKEEADGGIEKDCHVTIKYGLLTDDVKDIRDRLKNEKGGKFYLGESSIFETEKYDVVKIEVESDDFKRIHDRLNELPHEDKHPDYKAHATIAYVKKGMGKKYIGKFKINKSFKFKEVFFGNTKNKDFKIKLANEINWMKIACFNKELFKLSEIRGEWWIIDGFAIFADAEIGDMNHSGVVIEHILGQHDLDPDRVDVDKLTDEQLLENGLNQEEIDVVRDRVDPRDYGMKHLGWKRVAGNNIQTNTLTFDDLREIGNGIYDMDSEIKDDEEFYIEVLGNRKIYSNVPYSVISNCDLNQLGQYR